MKNITPQEAWNGVKPIVEHLRVWGSIVHVHISDEKRSKLDDKSMTCVLFGFSEESKGYRMYNPKTKKIVVSRDVVFEEDKRWNWVEEEEHTETVLTWNDVDLAGKKVMKKEAKVKTKPRYHKQMLSQRHLWSS